MKRKNKTLYICQGAIIAAAYAVLTLLSSLFGLGSGVVQLRISEALCVLPMFTSAAIPGLYIGCLVANLLSGAVWLDVVIGPVATLIGAIGAHALKGHKWLAPIPTVIANTLLVPPVLAYGYGMEEALPLIALGVGIGELLSAYVFGVILASALLKNKSFIFGE